MPSWQNWTQSLKQTEHSSLTVLRKLLQAELSTRDTSQGNDLAMQMQVKTDVTATALTGGTMTAGLTKTVKSKTVKTTT
jgi:hypothetical protein